MSHIDPNTITTSGTRTAQILINTGEGGYCIARVRSREGFHYTGIRWNGDDDKPLGYPTARGYPVWFVLPDDVADGMEKLAGQILFPA